ncbi:hypothetical protein ACFOFO_05245, partial [Undibacterium arcticum]
FNIILTPLAETAPLAAKLPIPSDLGECAAFAGPTLALNEDNQRIPVIASTHAMPRGAEQSRL